MTEVSDHSSLWTNLPVALDGWVLAHTSLRKDAETLLWLVRALLAQAEGGSEFTSNQRAALLAFYASYSDFMHQHHMHEEKFVFPYLSDVKKVPIPPKVSGDHDDLVAKLDKCGDRVALISGHAGKGASEDAATLKIALELFTALDADFKAHFQVEEEVVLPLMRRHCTPKEVAAHITKPIGASMSATLNGQYFSKLSKADMSEFASQEGIPFFACWILGWQSRRYTKKFVAPVEQAIAHAKTVMA